ncbi:MAG: hypothetical protein H0W69_01265 [Gemmatimonadaceae bacterium]|nr:hypothetical protein [Gemmatimonadaceae bacterium]
MEALDRALEPFSQTAEGFLFLDSLTRSRANLPDPAAIVVFPRDYQLAGHFLQLRGDRVDVKCSFCSYRPGDLPRAYPPVSIIYIPDWEIFADLASKSPLLAGAWDSVAGADKRQSWIILADPLSEPWASNAETTDDALFRTFRDNRQH